MGGGCLRRPPKLLGTQTGAATSWHRCNHTPPTIGDRANTPLSGPADPPCFLGFEWASSIRRGRGEGGQRLLHPKLGNSFPPHLHSSLSSCTHKHHCVLFRPSNSTFGQDEAGSELCPSAAHSTGWDFTRAKAQMDGPCTWQHLFFSNLFLNGVVILIGQWMTRMAGMMKSRVQQDS